MRWTGAVFAVCLLAGPALGEPPALTQEQAAARALLERAVAFKSTEEHGETPAFAAFLAGEFAKAGFPRRDIEIVEAGKSAGLVVRYRGDGSAREAPILFLAHMDAVEADPADWDYDPWTLTEKDGVFYGRGVTDNKQGVVSLTRAFIRLRKEGFVPDRDLVIAFTGDEETGMATTQALADKLKDAAFAINSDAGYGVIAPDGQSALYYVQAAEKTYATFEITATNPGGHSSAPRADNAIYELAAALKKIEAHRFPTMWNEISLRALEAQAEAMGDAGRAVAEFVRRPGDRKLQSQLQDDPGFARVTRTTCVATKLRAGHAENALPQSATATVNCRIFPGVAVDDVQSELARIVGNDALEIRSLHPSLESPVSIPTPEIEAAIGKAVTARFPGARIVPYLEAGGTDGLHFRRAGVPTFGVGSVFVRPTDELNFHGRNENLPVEAFYKGLDHWPILIRALAGAPDGE
jgi:carboxypeptidase PM20D1